MSWRLTTSSPTLQPRWKVVPQNGFQHPKHYFIYIYTYTFTELRFLRSKSMMYVILYKMKPHPRLLQVSGNTRTRYSRIS